MDKTDLSSKTVAQLRQIAAELEIAGSSKKTKQVLITEILTANTGAKETKEEPKEEQESKPSQSEQAKVTEPVKQKTEAVDAQKTKPTPALKVETPTHAPIVQSTQVPTLKEEAKPTEKSETAKAENTQSTQQSNQQKQNTGQQHKNRNQHHKQNNGQRPNNSQLNGNSNGNLQQENRFTNDSTVEISGILEIVSDGTHGVLRSPKLIASDKDTYISISQVKKFRLRKGDFVTGTARLPKENERYFSLLWIKDVNGLPLEKVQERPNFDELKPVYPDKQIKLEIGQYPIANRVIDFLAPIGFGQRSMIVAPPKSGKTYLLKDIARGINENHPNVQLIVVLIGERPEEVTDIERSVHGIVYASNFDDSPSNQVAVAELSLERAKRIVELGKDVIILMDSLTRLARAYNVALPASGRTLSGGLDPVSLYPSKRFFGAARNFENGASLTIVATSLVDTGSKMDEVIFEEFKGTGNMELHLNRRLSNKRVFPAIDTLSSGTRNEELLLGAEQLQHSWKIRRLLENLGNDSDEALIDRMKSTKSNDEFVQSLHQY